MLSKHKGWFEKHESKVILVMETSEIRRRPVTMAWGCTRLDGVRLDPGQSHQSPENEPRRFGRTITYLCHVVDRTDGKWRAVEHLRPMSVGLGGQHGIEDLVQLFPVVNAARVVGEPVVGRQFRRADALAQRSELHVVARAQRQVPVGRPERLVRHHALVFGAPPFRQHPCAIGHRPIRRNEVGG